MKPFNPPPAVRVIETGTKPTPNSPLGNFQPTTSREGY